MQRAGRGLRSDSLSGVEEAAAADEGIVISSDDEADAAAVEVELEAEGGSKRKKAAPEEANKKQRGDPKPDAFTKLAQGSKAAKAAAAAGQSKGLPFSGKNLKSSAAAASKAVAEDKAKEKEQQRQQNRRRFGNPNADVIVQFLDLAETARQAADKGWGGETMKFRASAYNNTAKALLGFRTPIAEENLKEVGALKGVGKGSLDRIKNYLQTGTIMYENEIEEQEAAATDQEKQAALAFL